MFYYSPIYHSYRVM